MKTKPRLDGLTSRQLEILTFMAERQAAGSPASLREIGAAVGMTSEASGPSSALKALAKKGWVERMGTGKYRNMRVVKLPAHPDGGDPVAEYERGRIAIMKGSDVGYLKIDEAVRFCVVLQDAIWEATKKPPGAKATPLEAEAGSRLPDETGV